MDVRSRKKVSTACSHCKLRKRRCSATLPCNNCVINKQKCVYDDSIDGRRKESIQRARLESNFHREVLEKLLDRIRTGNDDEVRLLIASDASMEEIATCLDVPYILIVETVPPSSGSEIRGDVDLQHHRDNLKNVPQRQLTCLRNTHVTAGYVEVFGNLPFSSAIPSAGYNLEHQRHQVSNFHIPEYFVLPLNWHEGEGSLSNLLLKWRDSSRADLAAGVPPAVVLGPETISLEVALRGLRDDDVWSPATWASSVQRSYEGIDKLTRLATVYLWTGYIRWLISPTARHYALMPECMRPTILQRLIPHHAAMDLAHHPALRDIMVLDSREDAPACEERLDLIHFQVHGLLIDWEEDIKNAVVVDPITGLRTFSRRFLDACDRVETWRTGSGFLRAMSQMAGKMVFVEEESIAIDDQQLHEIDWSGLGSEDSLGQ